MTTIAITGVTGQVGGRIARQFASEDSDVSLVLVARDLSRVPIIAGTETALAEYGDASAAEKALARTDVLFMVSAHEAADRLQQHRTLVAAAARAGVQHIVYTSFVGAGHSAGFTLARDHGATEEAIRDTGLDYTFLRDNFYLDVLLEFADESGVIRGPAGDGLAAAVARADVADAAVAVLRHPEEHQKTVYELTGREAIGLAEVAERASVATGRPFSYLDETVDEAHASRAHYGAPDWQVDAWVSTYTAIRDGELARVSGDVRKLTGHEPRVLEDVIAGI
jgi:NAD(P)H dehydrogenase (quinone)